MDTPWLSVLFVVFRLLLADFSAMLNLDASIGAVAAADDQSLASAHRLGPTRAQPAEFRALNLHWRRRCSGVGW